MIVFPSGVNSATGITIVSACLSIPFLPVVVSHSFSFPRHRRWRDVLPSGAKVATFTSVRDAWNVLTICQLDCIPDQDLAVLTAAGQQVAARGEFGVVNTDPRCPLRVRSARSDSDCRRWYQTNSRRSSSWRGDDACSRISIAADAWNDSKQLVGLPHIPHVLESALG